MFTGIVTDVGRVSRVEHAGDDTRDRRFEITTAFDTGTIDIGASIACSGVCLTVIEIGPDWFAVQASHETLGCTTLGDWTDGTPVNLERALKVGDELGGHIVSGHVDGVGRVLEIAPEADSKRYRIAAPAALSPMIAAKGSVTVEGVSLTVNDVGDNAFRVNIIPHTLSVTTLGALQEGAPVNLEVDMLARYVARLLGNPAGEE
ncbi:MAG: riboflavin synthase [Rhodospirillales bacterium]